MLQRLVELLAIQIVLGDLPPLVDVEHTDLKLELLALY
jgi:hypothetical protein